MTTADWAHNSVRDTPAPESKLFRPDELVLQGRPLRPGIEVPAFGRRDRWLFEAVRRPANVAPAHWVAIFKLFPGEWNLRIRELLMAVLNPQHPALLDIGVDLGRDPMDLRTMPKFLSGFRTLIAWTTQEGLETHPLAWTSSDMHRFLTSKEDADRSPASLRLYAKSVRLLHRLSPALTGGGLPADPWPGRTIRAIANDTRDSSELTTPNIRPETWFPLVKAAWTYIYTFSADIIRARDAFVGGEPGAGNLIDDLVRVTRPDSTTGPWHPGLNGRTLEDECRALRAACYIFVAAMSMMRDSEIREISRGGLVDEFFGAPAVVSRKRKQDPGRPLEHWWITEPVARAVVVAEELALHPELVFADPGLPETADRFSASQKFIDHFVRHVNAHRQDTGLPEIPDDHIAPHQFRKTMSMLVSNEPGAEIALGLQLKHAAVRALANRSTQGYAASDTRWARLLDTAIEHARFTRLHELYERHHAGETIGYGPGAENLANTFDAVKRAADEATRAAKSGDKRTEYDMLRKTRVSLRFGKLNHCTFDQDRPDGAKCIEEAVIPPGHTGPLIDRCQPGRCPNSVITPEHLKIWRSEETSLLTLLETPKLPRCRRDQLNDQLGDVRSVIRRAGK
jgi:hypothetical protein